MSMKTINFYLALLLMFVCCWANGWADEAEINLQYKGNHNTHYQLPTPADEPDVYYDNEAQEIIVDGDGTAAYYDIEIASAGTLAVVISTQVGGSYGTIDVSSLPSDHVYVITIYSPTGNTYEGTFDTY